jgi:hypothetical protein
MQKKNTSGEDRSQCELFEILDEILGSRPSANLEAIDAIETPSQLLQQDVVLQVDETVTEDETTRCAHQQIQRVFRVLRIHRVFL